MPLHLFPASLNVFGMSSPPPHSTASPFHTLSLGDRRVVNISVWVLCCFLRGSPPISLLYTVLWH